MPPRQNYQQPGQPQVPQPPQPPMYGAPAPAPNIQQAPNGQYQVVPAMQPRQNTGQSGHNPYEFIVAPGGGPTAKTSTFMNGDHLFLKIGMLAGALIIVIAIAAVAINLLTPKGPTDSFVSIVQRQQEIIRISTDAQKKATSPDARNFVANVLAVATSDQQATETYMTANKMKLDPKLIGADQDAQTDSTLAAAFTADNYDQAVTDNLTDQLTKYESLLQSTYKLTTGAKAKKLLQGSFTGADLLIQQGQALQKNDFNE